MIHRFYYYIVRNYYAFRYPKKIVRITPAGFDYWEEEFYHPGDSFSWVLPDNAMVYIGNNCFLEKGEL